ncbi:MAG: hypothetical protein ABJP70_10930 [Erythrobacter sp.]
MQLLFVEGSRPTRDAFREFTEAFESVSISFDPLQSPPLQLVSADGVDITQRSAASAIEDNTVWLELLRYGLTFDILGLAPGDATKPLEVVHRFDLDQSPVNLRYEAVQIEPGEHLSGGENSMPVARGMIALARDLTQHFDNLAAVYWPHAKTALGRRYFESIATAWLEGGAFPALGLTAFRETIDGALQSVGLEFWIGQELRIEQPLATDKVLATRLGVRIINQLILLGGLEGSERIVAPDGTRLVMRPSRNGKYIRVTHE